MKFVVKIAVLLSLVSFDLSAQSGGGYYQGLNYRQNDPFLLCTQGQDRRRNPAPCWIPLDSSTGTYFPMPYCRPYNKWGKRWSNDDRRSLAEYQSTCPHGGSGRWDGPGRPERTPIWH